MPRVVTCSVPSAHSCSRTGLEPLRTLRFWAAESLDERNHQKTTYSLSQTLAHTHTHTRAHVWGAHIHTGTKTRSQRTKAETSPSPKKQNDKQELQGTSTQWSYCKRMSLETAAAQKCENEVLPRWKRQLKNSLYVQWRSLMYIHSDKSCR